MAIQKNCGPQLINFYNLLHHLEHSTPQQTLLFTSQPSRESSFGHHQRSAASHQPHKSTTFTDLVPLSVEEAAKLLKSAPNKHFS